MKRYLAFLLALSLALSMLMGCQKTPTPPAVEDPVPEASEPAPENSEPTPEASEPAPESSEPAPEASEPTPEEPDVHIIDLNEIYGSSCYSFHPTKDVVYQVSSTVAEDFDFDSIEFELAEGAELWTIYVLDEEFEDAPRFLSQAYEPTLEGDGSIEVKAGQYVYCVCAISGFTASGEVPAGAVVLTLTR